jgi:hypothetical protein
MVDLKKLGDLGLEDIIKDSLEEGLQDLVEGAKEDFNQFVLAIQGDLLEAAIQGDEEIVDELKDQLKAVGELNRIRAVNESWETAGKVVKSIWTVAKRVAPLFLV